MANGADLVVAQLKAQGVTWLATLCGNGLNPFFDACCRGGIRVVDTHNEQAAAYMADACARLTGRLGVCAVSSGIAHINALSGVANAYFDGAPLLLITGASAGYGADRGVFQEFDQVALAAPICKYSRLVSRVEDLSFALREAISRSLAERPGPAHLTIPEDVFLASVPPLKGLRAVSKSESPIPQRSALGLAAKMIAESNRPVLVAGTGLFRSGGGQALVEFSEAFDVPFVIPIWDRGCVEKRHPSFMGVVGAASGEPPILQESDLILLVGASPDYRCGFLLPPKVQPGVYTIRIDSDPSELAKGRIADVALLGHPAKVLSMLARHRGEKGGKHRDWLNRCRNKLEEFRGPWTKPVPSRGFLTGQDIVEAIRPTLSENVILLIDGGNIGQWAHMVLADHYPSRWLTCGASAVVGWGIPGAMGARLEHPDRPILLLSGDGAFGFTPTELESAVRQELPFVAVVANDSAWGIVVCGQRDAWKGRTVASETREIRFDRLAEALGARGLRIERAHDLTKAIVDGFSQAVPTVIDVPTRVISPSDAKRECTE